eukprot:5239471-Amphidinium_carterae.1
MVCAVGAPVLSQILLAGASRRVLPTVPLPEHVRCIEQLEAFIVMRDGTASRARSASSRNIARATSGKTSFQAQVQTNVFFLVLRLNYGSASAKDLAAAASSSTWCE